MSFEVFWKAYPRRVAKKDAEKAWLKLKPSPQLVNDMLIALEWQREQDSWQKDGGQFIPYPASWLRAERWTDEPLMNMSVLSTHPAIREARAALELLNGTDGQRQDDTARSVHAVGDRHPREDRPRHLRALPRRHGGLFDGSSD